MKKLLISKIFLLLITFISVSCSTDYRDNNGDLGGMWQLTEWRVANVQDGLVDSIVATNEQGIYYSIQREFIQFSQTTRENFNYEKRYFGRIKHNEDILQVSDIYTSTNEESSLDQLSAFGVPLDGIFHIDQLSPNKLILSSKGNVMIFRKY